MDINQKKWHWRLMVEVPYHGGVSKELGGLNYRKSLGKKES